MKRFRYPVNVHLAILLALFVLTIAGRASSQAGDVVKLAKFTGPVTPVLASYIDRAISDAEDQNARRADYRARHARGLDRHHKGHHAADDGNARSHRGVGFAAGAHAGSAGTFITLAAHVAAMAPGSSIGAASPISSEGQDLGETAKAKAVNILVADIKNLTTRRCVRAVSWAQKAVAEAAAATAQEALDLGVIDVVAANTDQLLSQLDGRTITVADLPVTLQVNGVPIEEVPLNPLEGFLNQITNPALAAILLTIGINAILFELSSPGGFAAGVLGVICVLLALYSLGTINANWTGLGFVLLAVVLFVLDVKLAHARRADFWRCCQPRFRPLSPLQHLGCPCPVGLDPPISCSDGHVLRFCRQQGSSNPAPSACCRHDEHGRAARYSSPAVAAERHCAGQRRAVGSRIRVRLARG